MKKYLCILLALTLALSSVTCASASQKYTTDVTLTVEDTSGGGGTSGPDGGGNSGSGGSGTTKPGGGGTSNPGGGSGSGGGSGGSGGSGGGGASGGSGGSSGGGYSGTIVNTRGEKSGGVDSNGSSYYLLKGVHVSPQIVEDGYMRGYSNLTFGPDDYLTRAQFAVIMDRVFEFDNKKITKSFEDTAGYWAEESINRLASNGVILGVSSSEFRPNDGLTRGHVLLMLSRVLDISRYSKVSNLPSVKKYHAKETIARMLNSGIYDSISSDYDVNARITRAEMVHLMNNIIYSRNAHSAKNEQVLKNNQIFLDLTQNRSQPYYADSVKSLDYQYLMKEVLKLEK